MTLPGFDTLMLPLLHMADQGEPSTRDAFQRLADQFHLSQEEREQPMRSSRQPLFSNRAHWAITFLVHAGLVERPRRAHFRITDRGRALLKTNPPVVDVKLLKQYPEFVEWDLLSRKGKKEVNGAAAATTTQAASVSVENTDHRTPYERIEEDVAALDEALQGDLIERLLSTDPAFFEQVIVDLLVAMGYGGSRKEAGLRLGRSGDGGVDGLINEDPLGLDVIYVQAKRYKTQSKVSGPEVRGFAGSLEGFGANKGVFVTTSSFTNDARRFADRITRRMILIDGEELARLMSRYGVGVRTQATYEIKRVDEDYFPAD